jgi:hypothetical protein
MQQERKPMNTKILQWLLVAYFASGFMVCLIATADLLEEDRSLPDPDFRWWQVPRAYAFCLFLAPALFVYWMIKWSIEEWIRKQKAKHANK